MSKKATNICAEATAAMAFLCLQMSTNKSQLLK